MLLAVAIAALAGEIAFRAIGRRPYRKGISPHEYFWVADKALGYRNRPDGTLEYGLAGSTITTGPHGERKGVRWTDDPKRPLVVFVGDSTTFCAEVPDDETGPSEVAKHLPATIDVGVVNAGVRGYSTVQALRMAEEWLARANVRLVVYTYCDNDYYENVSAFANVSVAAPAARIGQGKLEFVEVQHAGAAGQPIFDPKPESWSTSVVRALESRSALLSGLSDLGRGRREAQGGIPKALPDGTEGFALVSLRELVAWAQEHQADLVLEKLVGAMDAACRSRGGRLLVTRYVTSSDGSCPGCAEEGSKAPREAIFSACKANGVPFAELSASFARPPETYLAHLANGSIDPHASREGTRTYAEALAPRVIEMLPGP